MEPSLLGRAPDAAQQLARLSPTAETDRTFADARAVVACVHSVSQDSCFVAANTSALRASTWTSCGTYERAAMFVSWVAASSSQAPMWATRSLTLQSGSRK
jgi:hypothetical protein